VSDWALDVAAAEHADDVAELVEAANEVLDAQEAAMEGRDAGDLRIRLKLLRVCTATVANLASAIAARAGQTGAGSSATDITTRLIEIAANRIALSLLERGLLGAEDPGVADPFGIGQPAATTAPAKAAKAAPKPKEPAGSESEKPAGPSAAELKKLQAALADAKKALAAAQAVSTAADKALAKQETAVARAESKVAEAERLLETRRDEVRGAKAELDDLWDRRDSAASDVSRAQSALDAAEAALAG
jgi:hypothetical protein